LSIAKSWLLRLYQYKCWQPGKRVLAEALLAWLPEFYAEKEVAVDLI